MGSVQPNRWAEACALAIRCRAQRCDRQGRGASSWSSLALKKAALQSLRLLSSVGRRKRRTSSAAAVQSMLSIVVPRVSRSQVSSTERSALPVHGPA